MLDESEKAELIGQAGEFERQGNGFSAQNKYPQAFTAYAYAADLYEEAERYCDALRNKRRLLRVYQATGNKSGEASMLWSIDLLEKKCQGR